uniref:ATP synthase F0 subunit 8 n=1 Tax=Cyphocaris challengeri TaxID=3018532 RepID=UPI0022FD6431|nr:ATP synthase F0 subunit 8 [Cyphocaris challengeri]WBQ48835.1 ATP synthase F0 subunit 8 [Cyphocaris challengeri]
MPQMAPSLWVPLIILMFILLIYLKSILYFSPLPSHLPKLVSIKPSKNHNWMW